MRQQRPTITRELDSRQGAFPLPVPIAPSNRIGDVRHARLWNSVFRPAGDVCDFLRGRRSLAPEEIFGPVLTHWDEASAYAVLGHLAAVLV